MNASRKAGPLFVVNGKAGQLGNRLFFFAYVISLASKLGGRVINPGFNEYAAAFTGTCGGSLSRWPARKPLLRARWLGTLIGSLQNLGVRIANRLRLSCPGVKILGLHEKETVKYRLDNEPFLDSLRNARIVFISGWLDLPHVRFEQPDAIRAHFTPVASHRDAITGVISRARAGCDVLIGVHIRQGDYATFLGGRYFYPTGRVRARHEGRGGALPREARRLPRLLEPAAGHLRPRAALRHERDRQCDRGSVLAGGMRLPDRSPEHVLGLGIVFRKDAALGNSRRGGAAEAGRVLDPLLSMPHIPIAMAGLASSDTLPAANR